MSHSIYDILNKLSRLDESITPTGTKHGLNPQQKSVPQLPAQANPKSISVLGAKTDPKHPFAGYMVGADESVEKDVAEGNPTSDPWIAYDKSNPDKIKKFKTRDGAKAFADKHGYGVASFGFYHDNIKDKQNVAEDELDEACWKGYHKEGNKELFGKRVPNCVKNEAAERNELDGPRVQAALKKMAERHRGEKWSKEQLAALGQRIAARGQGKDVKETGVTHKGGQVTKTTTGIRHQAAPGNYGGYEPEQDHLKTLDKSTTNRIERELGVKFNREKAWQGGVELDEAVTKEDVISKLKAKLGDYLSDLSKEIKSDPDLQDKLAAKPAADEIGPPVKKITTDDGHEISIHGNEDDGFRISIKNRPASSQFKNLDEAVMACEMYCAHRRAQQQNADYIEEAGKDACYNKVKSRYKIWPSAYASGALVRCRKVGADNWGNKSKK